MYIILIDTDNDPVYVMLLLLTHYLLGKASGGSLIIASICLETLRNVLPRQAWAYTPHRFRRTVLIFFLLMLIMSNVLLELGVQLCGVCGGVGG